MRLLKIAGLGVIIWSLSLIWLEVNQLLLSPELLGLVVGMTILTVYFLGKYFGWYDHSPSTEQIIATGKIPPAVLVYARNHHSLPTRPMAVAQTLHSQPTRPMPISLSR
jgi:hypothetical protein